MKRNLLITVATIGLLGKTWGAGQDVPNGQGAVAAPAGIAVHADLAANPQIQALIDGMGVGYEDYILDRLAAMELNQRLDFLDHLNPLIAGTEGVGRFVLIQAFFEFPAATQIDISAKGPELFGVGMNGFYRVQLIRMLAEMPAQHRAGFIASVSPLIEGIEGADRVTIVKALVAIPAAERGELSDQAHELIGAAMEGVDRCRIIEKLADIPAGEREVFFENIMLLMEGMEGKGRWDIVNFFAAVPAADRPDVAIKAHELIDAGMDSTDRTLMINALRRVSTEDRGLFIEMLTPLIDGVANVGCIFHSFAEVPAEEREGIKLNALGLFEVAMTGAQRGTVIQILAGIPAADRGGFIHMLNDVFEGAEDGKRLYIIQAFATLPAAEREDVADRLPMLFGGSMPSGLIYQAIKTLGQVPMAERNDFIERLQPVIEDIEDKWISTVAAWFADVPSDRRAHAIDQMLVAVEAGMDGEGRAQLMRQIAQQYAHAH